MTRYFIDLINGHGKTVDEEGQMFSTPLDAGRAALRVLAEIALDEQADADHVVLVSRVRTDAGQVVYEGRLSLVGRWVHVSE